MDLYVSKDQLKEVSDVLGVEGVNFQITDKTFSLIIDGKEIAEVAEIQAQIPGNRYARSSRGCPGCYSKGVPVAIREKVSSYRC